MNLQAQIELMTNPQDFTRLCNAVLQAEHGSDFLPIDDDRADRGNDGYLKSEKRMFAAHCFKRIQNQQLDKEIRSKMLGDLQKAIKLKEEGRWEVDAWTFLSNYPIPEGIAAEVVATGTKAGVDVSWSGPGYFAEVLQRLQSVRELFPNLLGNDVLRQLDTIVDKLNSLSPPDILVNWVPRTPEEQRALISQRPRGWEYMLFAGVLFQGKERLEPKWRDYKAGHGRRTGKYLDDKAARAYLGGIFSDIMSIANGIMRAFDENMQLEAFGAPGEHGNPRGIEHIAGLVVESYEDLLDWAAEIRGTIYPDRMNRAFSLAALTAAQPAEDIRLFIDQTVAACERIPAILAQDNPRPTAITLHLTLTANDDALAAFKRELKRLKA